MRLLTATILALSATTAHAQSPLNTAHDAGVYLTPLEQERGADGAIAEVVHRNRWIAGIAGEVHFYEYDTPYGEMVIRLEHTDNAGCPGGCPDILEAWLLPEGYVADPPVLVTPEEGVGIMIIRRWQGM